MSRPIKWRSVCGMPGVTKFGPLGVQNHSNGTIQMTVDEYETIRLIDQVGYTQEQCAKQMNVARTTVQGIYNIARKKIAESIIEGKVLFISGGEYKLCSDFKTQCNGNGCHGRGRGKKN